MGEDQHAACPCVITDTHTSMGGQLVGFPCPPHPHITPSSLMGNQNGGKGSGKEWGLPEHVASRRPCSCSLPWRRPAVILEAPSCLVGRYGARRGRIYTTPPGTPSHAESGAACLGPEASPAPHLPSKSAECCAVADGGAWAVLHKRERECVCVTQHPRQQSINQSATAQLVN
ncbi:hypothetical protein CCHR01_18395 [Colletotrichum chrysophilum]|uniref:Uncharacterized protein n=1 Tax=Colletotrichum chrysophilum TaxID=1836956 RepID=A0AAD9E617_9PEZI|nr:hypothetical protein CCHR01_18395 [Colletotrichum chrysophilum]